ncbi:MAG: CehA/McbA family metallohydrolase [Verrucomicrobiota bacterium]
MNTRIVDLSKYLNWSDRGRKDSYSEQVRRRVGWYPVGRQTAWGIPFALAGKRGRRLLSVAKDESEITVPLQGTATYLCFLHEWIQSIESARPQDPHEGLVVGEYELQYRDGTRHVQLIRARFEVGIHEAESPGPSWLAVPWDMWQSGDETVAPENLQHFEIRGGLRNRNPNGPLLYAMPNPHPGKPLQSLTLRGLSESYLLVAALTLYRGTAHPLTHLPRRAYRVKVAGAPAQVIQAEADLGVVARIETANAPRTKEWLNKPGVSEPMDGGEKILHLTGAADATVTVGLEQDGKVRTHAFNLGEAFREGRSVSGTASLEILDQQRQWMQVRVIDSSTGKPTPVRIHISGPRGNYIAPYGHHDEIRHNSYGADILTGGRGHAYVNGDFTTDLPVGDLYVEVSKGFEYEPKRCKVTIRPGQKELDLRIDRWTNLRKQGWVTADTHVHYLSPHTAWLEGQAEGINVINLLASQWGRMFSNVGDLTGRPGVVENDTIVFVGTENRNHMLGHMSMLGTKGPQPVYPMCGGGPAEAWLGDPDVRLLADWARENRAKGGVVIRPHFPECGHTEDPLPILQGLVDAVELPIQWEFPYQEWYRYLNCGYRLAVCGGTDKMGPQTALGWQRTYARLDPNRPFTYDAWAAAVKKGRTFSSNGPLIDMTVDGQNVGEAIAMTARGGSVEVRAWAEGFVPLCALEILSNGKVIAQTTSRRGQRRLELKERVPITGSGWLAARCRGQRKPPQSWQFVFPVAHTSPVYITCGDRRAFDGPAMEHMLALVSGGIEYMQTIATCFDEATRKRMVKQLQEAQNDLKCRLVVEGGHTHHHGDGVYHTHGHGGLNL